MDSPPPIVIPPKAPSHSISIIFLHGRGQTAEHFHGPLLSTPLASHAIFQDALPHAKFIFPTAPLMRATKYRRSLIRQWYDGTGDWEPEALGNIRRSVDYIHQLVRDEVKLLGDDARRVVLAGFSQGCAMALVSFLLWEGGTLGAALGLSGFMPLNAHMTSILEEDSNAGDDPEDGNIVFEYDSPSDSGSQDCEARDTKDALQRAIGALREEAELPNTGSLFQPSFIGTPVFLGHGLDDKEVDSFHGRQNARLLEMMGVEVEFRTYNDVGHSYSAEILGDIASFLQTRTAKPEAPE